MDPNETLRLLRLTIQQMRVDEHPGVRQAHANEIAEYAEALDQWLSTGGFLPAAWQASMTSLNREVKRVVACHKHFASALEEQEDGTFVCPKHGERYDADLNPIEELTSS